MSPNLGAAASPIHARAADGALPINHPTFAQATVPSRGTLWVASKPAPGPQIPIAAPRPSPSGGRLGAAAVPAAGPAPAALKQAVAAAIQAQAGKHLQPALPAANLPAHGTLIGALPAAKTSGTAGPAAPPNPANKPLLIPAPNGHRSGTGRFPTGFYNSTEVDNNTAFCDFGVNETSIAQSSANPNLIVAGANTYENGDGSCGNSHAFSYYSHDGGQHWQQTILPGLQFQASGDPGLTYDPVHQVFVYSFVEFDLSDSGGRIGVEVSSDGLNWGLNTTLETNSTGHDVDKPMITVDQNPGSPHYGRVMVSWTDFQNSGSVFFEDYTDDGGHSWHNAGQSINFTNVSTCGNGTAPAFDANGQAMVAWWDCDTSPSQLREERSDDGGANWTFTPDVTIASVNDIGTAGSDGQCLMDNGGTAFRCNSFPSLAGDPNAADAGGTAFVVVWANADSGTTDPRFPGQSATISQIHGISTVDGGNSWNLGAFSFAFMNFANFGDKFFPWVTFSPNGRLNMGYSNRADDASAGNPNGASFDEWMTEAGNLTSLRNASYITFVADGTLASPGFSSFIGDYAGTTNLDNNFDTFPVWTDERTGSNRARTMDLCYADCYTFLQPYTPLSIGHAAGSSFTDLYQYNTDPAFGGSGFFFWNAVGIRAGADGTSVDDDTNLYGDRYFSNLLTFSDFSPPFNDYTLENDNRAPSGPYFPQVHSFSSLGGSYSIEWAAGSTILGTFLSDTMEQSNVVRVYDTFLNTGTQYFIGLRPLSGNTSNYRLALHSASNGDEQGSFSAVADSGNVAPGQPAFVSYNTGAETPQFDGVVVLNNNGGAGTYNLYEDTAAPSGSIAINGSAAFTNNANVTLTLTATNPTSGDPVSDMRFSTDGVTFGAWQAFTGSTPFSLPSGDGSKTVFVQFRNGAGAVSATASASITLDTTAPSTTASLSGVQSGSGASFVTPVQVTLTASDTLSGIASTIFQIDGGAVQTYSAPFTVSSNGTHTVTFHSTDRAGNVEGNKSSSFQIARWLGQTSGTAAALRAVACPSSSACFAVGSGGTIRATTNGGSTWSSQTSRTTNQLNGVSCASTTVCTAVGAGGTIRATINGGSTWSTQASGTTNQLNAVSCLSSSVCFAVGAGGTIRATTNGGRTWSTQTSGTANALNAVSCASTTVCTAVGAGGTIRATTNGGGSWSGQTSGTTNQINGVSCASTAICFAVDSGGTIRATTNGGSAWTAQGSGTANALNAVSCSSTTVCTAVGNGGTIVATTNGGTAWGAQPSGLSTTLRGVSTRDSTTAFAVGDAGTILRRG